MHLVVQGSTSGGGLSEPGARSLQHGVMCTFSRIMVLLTDGARQSVGMIYMIAVIVAASAVIDRSISPAGSTSPKLSLSCRRILIGSSETGLDMERQGTRHLEDRRMGVQQSSARTSFPMHWKRSKCGYCAPCERIIAPSTAWSPSSHTRGLSTCSGKIEYLRTVR